MLSPSNILFSQKSSHVGHLPLILYVLWQTIIPRSAHHLSFALFSLCLVCAKHPLRRFLRTFPPVHARGVFVCMYHLSSSLLYDNWTRGHKRIRFTFKLCDHWLRDVIDTILGCLYCVSPIELERIDCGFYNSNHQPTRISYWCYRQAARSKGTISPVNKLS